MDITKDVDGKIFVGIPRERVSFNQFIDNRDRVLARLQELDRFCGYFNAEGHRVDRNRDGIVQAFLEKEEKPPWLLMIDTDMEHPADAPERLVAWGKPIVGALYFHRGQTHDPFVFQYSGKNRDKYKRLQHTWTPMRKTVYDFLMANGVPMRDGAFTVHDSEIDPLIECDAVATGCMLIHRSVFEKMKPPYFEYISGGNSEDLVFCMNAKKAGFKVYADISTVCGHFHWVPMGQAQFRMNYEGRGMQLSGYSKRQAAKWVSQFFSIPEKKALEQVKEGNAHMVGDYWKEYLSSMNGKPLTPEAIDKFYELPETGKLYVMELLHWNFSIPFTQLRQTMTGIRNYNVIEIGAGIGTVSLQLVAQENNVLAVEPSKMLRDFMDMRWKDPDYSDHEDFQTQLSIVGKEWKSQCKDSDFDVAVSLDTFEHMSEPELVNTLGHIHRVLKPGGKLVYHANWSQQDLYPMHFDHRLLFGKTCHDLGFMYVNEMEFLKVK